MPKPNVADKQLIQDTYAPQPGGSDPMAAAGPSSASTRLSTSTPLSASAPTSAPRTVIDHRAFPHVMDAIIAASDLATLSTLALTCRKYHAALDPLGSHWVVTRQGGDLVVAPFCNPSAARVPAVFRDGSQSPAGNSLVGGSSESLRGVRLVDIHLDQVSDDDEEKVVGSLVCPTVVRTRCFLALDATVYIHVINNVARYHARAKEFVYNNSPKLIYDTEGEFWDYGRAYGDNHEYWTTKRVPTFRPADKVVLVVNYSPRVAPRWPDFEAKFSAPLVVHFVELDDSALGHTARTSFGFSADDAFNVVCSMLWEHSSPITVVGLETIAPWQFNKYWLKDKVAHLEPHARHDHIRTLLAENVRCDVSLLRLVTVEEYAREVSPAMLALERGEGFRIPCLDGQS